MSFTLADVPAVDGAPPKGVKRVKRRVAASPSSFTRRGFLRAAFVIGTGVGLTALSLLPTARPAGAHEKRIKGSCPVSYEGTCSPACAPSPVCSDCCTEGTPVNACVNPKWFKNSGNYRYRVHDCWGGHYDGWNWSANDCSCCFPAVSTYRCHDGDKKIEGVWRTRICRSRVTCGNCRCT
jgi:hypothetical protein